MADQTARRNINEKLVFCAGETTTPIGRGMSIMIGIPEDAYEKIKDGTTHEFDLSSIGCPLQIVIYRGVDHDACVKVITDACRDEGVSIIDERRRDWKIKPGQKNG